MKKLICMLLLAGCLAGCRAASLPETPEEPEAPPAEELAPALPVEEPAPAPEEPLGNPEQEYFDTYLRTWGYANPFWREFTAEDNPLEEENLYLMFRAAYLLEHEREDLEALAEVLEDGTEVYPAELVEDTLTAHFNVTAEQLRASAEGKSKYRYHEGAYEFGTGYGGVGLIGAVTGFREEGDRLELEYSWFENDGMGQPGEKTQSGVLTIRFLPEGGWKYEANRIVS